MCKLLILLSLPLLVAANDASDFKELFDKFLSSNNSEVCQAEFEKYKSCYSGLEEKLTASAGIFNVPSKETVSQLVDDSKVASACVGEVNCNKFKLAEYLNQGATFFMEKSIRDNYDCIAESNFPSIAFRCFTTVVPHSVFNSGDPLALTPYVRPVFKCVAQKLTSCSAEGRLSFYKGGLGAADIMEVTVQMLKAQAADSLDTYVDSFDQKFDPTAYDNVQL